MTTLTTAISIPEIGAAPERTQIERRTLGPTDVRIGIRYAGVCHSDIHQALGHWGKNLFPMVPGHEITGIVEEVGTDVTAFAVGDRAGVGVLYNSCGTCDNCRAGLESYCRNGQVETYNDIDKYGDGARTYGGYSREIVAHERFVLRIPENLSLEEAAPLLCAGITTYSPLKHWAAGPGKKVAVLGLGGLGHMAVKIAHAMGAEVSVLSQSLRKKEDGLRLGADHYYATSDSGTFDEVAGTFDLIINTISAPLNLEKHLALLNTNGTMVYLGVPEQAASVEIFSLLQHRRSLSGSLVGGIAETQEMLDFCAEHGLGAEIEIVSADEIQSAWDRVLASDVRYRFVIDAATI